MTQNGRRRRRWIQFGLVSVGLAGIVGVIILVLGYESTPAPDPHLRLTLQAQEAVHVVAIDPQATLVASGSFSGTISVWHTADGTLLRHWQAHPQKVTALRFSNNGALLLSGGDDGQVIAWDMASGNPRYTLPPIATEASSFGIEAIAIHPQRSLAAAGGWQGQLLLFEVETGQFIRRWRGHPLFNAPGRFETITALTFSADGISVASGSSSGGPIIWNITNADYVQTSDVPAVDVLALQFIATDQQIRAIFRSQALPTWMVADGSIVRNQRLPGREFLTAVFDQTGTYLIHGGPSYRDAPAVLPFLQPEPDPHIYVNDVRSGATVLSLEGHKALVNALALSADDTVLVSGDEDATVRVWQLTLPVE